MPRDDTPEGFGVLTNRTAQLNSCLSCTGRLSSPFGRDQHANTTSLLSQMGFNFVKPISNCPTPVLNTDSPRPVLPHTTRRLPGSNHPGSQGGCTQGIAETTRLMGGDADEERANWQGHDSNEQIVLASLYPVDGSTWPPLGAAEFCKNLNSAPQVLCYLALPSSRW
ncbi:hypothetical protein FA13DRAFT_1740020 [Coprinellus micaceus]|uniref:Uncharacterized protein n=1 Tax=Coprinellus micaceus TaxID=71717 RepID=A0A4Y7SP51_COPMI|nr:hypothetical protein FA13DRAFT_1740020 [Coprinellus micaceus]